MTGQWQQYELSGWWRRALAWVLDGAIVFVAYTAILLLLGYTIIDQFSGGVPIWLRAAAGWGLSLIYFPALLVQLDGQTVGKLVVGVRVVRTDGRPMSWKRAALRDVLIKEIVWGVSFGAAAVVDALWPLWDKENRALHDMAARTRVVRIPQEAPSPVAARAA